jgi:FkbM family methyltransferase
MPDTPCPTETLPGRAAAAQFAAAEAHLRAAGASLDQAAAAFAAAATLDPAPTAAAQEILWTLQRRRGQQPVYFSESFQDRFLHEALFHRRRGGIFVDIGAYDGVTGSNTLFFEKFRGWTGLCIEADADRYAALRGTRGVPCLQTCIAGHDGVADFLRVRDGFTQMGGLAASMPDRVADYLSRDSAVEKVVLPTRRLDHVLQEHGLHRIDYLSIDIEGAEFDVLRTLDFDRFRITAISVERNSHEGALHDLLHRAGFCRVRQLGGDDIFVQATQASHLMADMLGAAIECYGRGEMPRAEAAYRDVLCLENQNPGIHYNYALALLAQGKHMEAQSALAAALALRPDFAPALALRSH